MEMRSLNKEDTAPALFVSEKEDLDPRKLALANKSVNQPTPYVSVLPVRTDGTVELPSKGGRPCALPFSFLVLFKS